VNEALKGFAHVNKKAYEQYQSFTKQRDELNARQEELDESQKSILELIDVLDARKDEAIERTFKQVAKNFEEVFDKLVPTGRGRLIMLKRQQDRVSASERRESLMVILILASNSHRMRTIWMLTNLNKKEEESRTTREFRFESRSNRNQTKDSSCNNCREDRKLLSLLP